MNPAHAFTEINPSTLQAEDGTTFIAADRGTKGNLRWKRFYASDEPDLQIELYFRLDPIDRVFKELDAFFSVKGDDMAFDCIEEARYRWYILEAAKQSDNVVLFPGG